MSDLTDFLAALGGGLQAGGQAGFSASQARSRQRGAEEERRLRAEQNAILNQFKQLQIAEAGRSNIAGEELRGRGLDIREMLGLSNLQLGQNRLGEQVRSNLEGEALRGRGLDIRETLGLGGLDVSRGRLAETERANLESEELRRRDFDLRKTLGLDKPDLGQARLDETTASRLAAMQRFYERLRFDIHTAEQGQAGLSELLGLPPTTPYQPQFQFQPQPQTQTQPLTQSQPVDFDRLPAIDTTTAPPPRPAAPAPPAPRRKVRPVSGAGRSRGPSGERPRPKVKPATIQGNTAQETARGIAAQIRKRGGKVSVAKIKAANPDQKNVDAIIREVDKIMGNTDWRTE